LDTMHLTDITNNTKDVSLIHRKLDSAYYFTLPGLVYEAAHD